MKNITAILTSVVFLFSYHAAFCQQNDGMPDLNNEYISVAIHFENPYEFIDEPGE
jgi:hypothetical protein